MKLSHKQVRLLIQELEYALELMEAGLDGTTVKLKTKSRLVFINGTAVLLPDSFPMEDGDADLIITMDV